MYMYVYIYIYNRYVCIYIKYCNSINMTETNCIELHLYTHLVNVNIISIQLA